MNTKTLTKETKPLKASRLLSIKYLESYDLLVIKGWSISPELRITYDVILEEIEEHLTNKEGLKVYFAYELFHTATTKFLFDTIKLLNRFHMENKAVSINWVIDEQNTEMLKMGLELREFCQFAFKVEIGCDKVV